MFEPHFQKIDRGALLFIGLLLAVIALYLPGIAGPFMFDDAPNIVDNALLTARKETLLDWWAAAQSSGAGALRRPVAMLSFALQIPDGTPLSALWLKVGNVVLHLACAAIIYGFCTALLRAMQLDKASQGYRYLPVLACAFWALNPLHVSTVLYPVQRMAQFATLFCLLGLWSWTLFRARWVERTPTLDEAFAAFLWLALFTLLAAYSKENGILLPALVAVLEVTLLRGRWAKIDSEKMGKLTDLVFISGLLAGGLFLYLKWDWVVAGYDYRSFTVGERLWTQARLLWDYIGWFVLPRSGELGLFHDDLRVSTSWLQPLSTVLAVAAWVIVMFAAQRLRRVFPWVLFAFCFYLVGHSLESGPLALELVFEHRNYLPTVALAILLAALFCALLRRADSYRYRRGLILVVPLLLLFYALTLFSRASSWSSEQQLASDSLARHPDSARSAHFYATTLIKALQAPGLSAQSTSEYLAVARHEFEALHNKKPSDLSALVMLYTLDSRYFKDIVDPEDWLKKIEHSVESSQLLATEYAAMRVFLYCFRDGFCEADPDRISAMVDVFELRYAHAHAAAQLRLQWLSILGAPKPDVESYLVRAVNRSPSKPDLRYQLIQSHLAAGDYARAHREIVALLQHDPSQRQLAVVHNVFRNSREQ